MMSKLKFCSLFMLWAGFAGAQNVFPTNGNVGIGIVAPQVELDIAGSLFLKSSLTNQSLRPPASSGRIWAEVRGYSSNGHAYDDGFLRLSAGGGTTSGVISHIDLSGYSTVPDMDRNIAMFTDGQERFRIATNGNIGLGTANPGSLLSLGASLGHQKLSVFENGNFRWGFGIQAQQFEQYMANDHPGNHISWGSMSTDGYQTFSELMRLSLSGNVGIGTTSPAEKLSVNGNIRAKEIKVETANWPDYVFRPDYKLKSLEATEKFIAEKGHLPGMPTAKDAEENGISLGEMNRRLLEKVEELTLHLINNRKEMAELRARIQKLEKSKQ